MKIPYVIRANWLVWLLMALGVVMWLFQPSY